MVNKLYHHRHAVQGECDDGERNIQHHQGQQQVGQHHDRADQGAHPLCGDTVRVPELLEAAPGLSLVREIRRELRGAEQVLEGRRRRDRGAR
eukprot:123486-Rhodomonas_salina.2